MGRSSRSRKEASSSRRRRKSDDSESDSYTGSEDSDSQDSSPARSPSKRKERSSSRRRRSSSRRKHSDDESYESDESEERDRKKKRSSRNVTEEEIAEYLAKKAQKKAARVAKKLKSKTVSGYSNDSNPFGDSNLNETAPRDVSAVQLKDISIDIFILRKCQIMHDFINTSSAEAEVEKVKKRREERALEKAQHEEEMALLARERARAEFQDWEKKEEEFHFDQSKMRSEIRLREGRIKPIDVLSKHLDGSDDLDIEINEPYMVFKFVGKVLFGGRFELGDPSREFCSSQGKGLTVKEMEELRDDIKMHLGLDRSTPTHIEYWEALLVVCDWELSEARKKDALDRARVRGEEPPAELLAEQRGLHSSIEADVKNLLEGKTYSQLEALQSEIESQMRSGTAKVVEYWEAVLTRLHIFKAKACLKEIHAKMLRKHLQRLEGRVDGKEKLDMPIDLQQEEESEPDANGAETYSPQPVEEEIHVAEEEAEEAGSFSPELLHGDENEEVMDPEEDRAILERKRMAVLEEQQIRIKEAMASKPALPPEDIEMKAAMKAMGAMEEGDAIFGSNSEVNLDSQVYWWHDKYRPRKPKYFNRVHTGYEWNKYNQTHYDHDNPPPKIVQGYKFNIFYPDLVDKIKAPTYTIERDGNSSETCIIRFHAGPPYEDIAFRIVNKEWEYSHKKGFKCTFERGILHVYFNFKRYRYRSIGYQTWKLEDLDSSCFRAPQSQPALSYASMLKNPVDRFSSTMSEDFHFSDTDCQYSQGKHGLNVSFSDKVHNKLDFGWRCSVIIKLMGKPNSTNTFDFILKGLRRKWQTKGGWQLIDLPNDYFIVKFNLEDDMNDVLCGGPWIIAGQILTVRKWSPDFDPTTDVIGKMALWVRICGLPVKFFKEYAEDKIGKILREVIKVDPFTGQARGKFARVCIEVDLSKPLRPYVEDKCTSVIVNPVVRSETCDPKASSNLGASNDNSEMTHEMDTVNDSPSIIKEDMGPWMMNYRNKKKVSKVGGSGQTPAKGFQEKKKKVQNSTLSKAASITSDMSKTSQLLTSSSGKSNFGPIKAIPRVPLNDLSNVNAGTSSKITAKYHRKTKGIFGAALLRRI
ncbi:hypothetical protein ACLB2K_060153 [Fragaria x ananassa]